MTLKECYRILQLDKSASLDEVKHAYRRRAFELHPDLNPGLTDAGAQFQRLNEAYVILSKIIILRESQAGRQTDKADSSDQGQKKAAPSEEKHTAQGDESTSRHEGASDPEGNDGRTHSNNRAAARDRTSDDPSFTGGPTETSDSTRERKHAHTGEQVYAGQQEVLKDILNDPFARRVFEDIYSEIRKNAPPSSPGATSTEEGAGNMRSQPARPNPFSELKRRGLDWGQSKLSHTFSRKIGGAVKNWLQGQIDEEQVFVLPAKRLVPGARIRLQIRRGLSGELTTLDVTLPPDFHPDKPIRLKGMGKQVGHWQGDLYLRFSSKD